VTTETWLGFVYSTHPQAEHSVDHSYEIKFQPGLWPQTAKNVKSPNPFKYVGAGRNEVGYINIST